MSQSDVTKEGLRGERPDREAMTGVNVPRRWRGKRRAEQPMVPPAEFTSYYGKPIINQPVWESPDIPGYLFLGGLAGGCSLLAAGSDLTGRPTLGKTVKTSAVAAGALSVVALVHDLGRPGRFLNMMRVFKVTSPMSVGSWLLGGYVPAAGVAALTALTGRLPRLGAAATAGSALLGPAVASYTAALISNTAVPAWHDGYPEMPFVFTGSGMMAAGGLGMTTALLPGTGPDETTPARYLAVLGAAMEIAAFERMEHRIGMTAEPYSEGKGGKYVKAGKLLAAAGTAGTLLSAPGLAGRLLPGRVRRALAAASGATLVVASAATRWGIYHAGMASAGDPKYTVVPQRQRLNERARADGAAGGSGG
ncbi:MAG TPA: NrfD/PsrC family molybdoenzyme membrane anchor subunit [Trebonia sp.]|jgi:formate-dependent nitrite reductase membrane component NrfD|nr:NrfD/PsrC family molybdoenzyme membrane anchor subunit [Trebonia sp.]